MKKRMIHIFWLMAFLLLLSGCGRIGQKNASVSIIYGVTAVLSLLLLLGYCIIVRKKNIWFLVLFSSVLVVNIGYYALGVSKTLDAALLANRVSYFGSVFLPLSMLMIIFEAIHAKYNKWLTVVLLGVGFAVFLVAASPGYLTIYYKEVVLETVNGVSVLKKTYGSWHVLYLLYLIGYFVAMVAAITYAAVRKKLDNPSHAAILAIAVFVNLGVWLIEQLVQIDFEILAVSYIISELFLLCQHLIMTENERLKTEAMRNASVHTNTVRQEASTEETPDPLRGLTKDDLQHFSSGLMELTRTERLIFDNYLSGKSTKEIMAELNIKENTLKFHNKNLYGKLGVSSRKQLVRTAQILLSTGPQHTAE